MSVVAKHFIGWHGQETFFISAAHIQIELLAGLIPFFYFISRIHDLNWQARRDSNPHHAVLETAALPIGATGLQFPECLSKSIANVTWSPDEQCDAGTVGQNFFVSRRSVFFFLFFVIE